MHLTFNTSNYFICDIIHKIMYDLTSYLAQMSSGLTTHKKLEEARYGKAKKKKKKRPVSYRDYHVIEYKLTEEDLP